MPTQFAIDLPAVLNGLPETLKSVIEKCEVTAGQGQSMFGDGSPNFSIKLRSNLTQDQFDAFLSDDTIAQTLESLDITHCKNLFEFEGLVQCSGLKVLTLNHTKFSRIGVLTGLKSLEKLSLCGCGSVDDFSGLASLLALKELNLSATHIISLEALAGHQNLVKITLNGTRVESVSPLTSCSKLEFVGLEDTQVLAPSDLSACQSINHVILPDGRVLCGQNITELKDITFSAEALQYGY